MKVGDQIKVKNNHNIGVGTVLRFYANHGTALVKFEDGKRDKDLVYCLYSSLEIVNESR